MDREHIGKRLLMTGPAGLDILYVDAVRQDMLNDAEDGGRGQARRILCAEGKAKRRYIYHASLMQTYWRQVGMEQSIGWSTEHILVFRCEWMGEAAGLHLLLKTEENH